MFVVQKKKQFESYTHIRSRTSRRIYRLALPLRTPETLSSLSKSRISIFNEHLALSVRRMMSHNSIGKYRHLVNRLWNLPWNGESPLADQTTRVESLQNWERSECEEFRLRRGLPLACGVMCFVSSSLSQRSSKLG